MPLAIKHNFVSAIADGTDATLVKPSNWNDSHQIAATTDVQATGNLTVDVSKPLQAITNAGNFNINAPATDGSCLLLVSNSLSAGAIGFPGFTVGGNTGDTLDATSGHLFTISIWRVNGISGYRVAAHQ